MEITFMYSWQYNGNGKMPWAILINWCDKNLDPADWSNNNSGTIYFKSKNAYIMFILRWD